MPSRRPPATCDAAGPGRWSRAAAEDAVEAIETTANALVTARPGAELIHAALRSAVADLRRHLALPPADPLDAPGLPPAPRTLGNPRRTRRGVQPMAEGAIPAPAGENGSSKLISHLSEGHCGSASGV
ncbi:hypothetical protein [Streptomyces sp. NPDC048603]|uniref:hypothetical protein n=1 Tax=Streptomyces sp. NPDC048603 TaxID=3365577 RepID=UPI00371C6C91